MSAFYRGKFCLDNGAPGGVHHQYKGIVLLCFSGRSVKDKGEDSQMRMLVTENDESHIGRIHLTNDRESSLS